MLPGIFADKRMDGCLMYETEFGWSCDTYTPLLQVSLSFFFFLFFTKCLYCRETRHKFFTKLTPPFDMTKAEKIELYSSTCSNIVQPYVWTPMLYSVIILWVHNIQILRCHFVIIKRERLFLPWLCNATL